MFMNMLTADSEISDEPKESEIFSDYDHVYDAVDFECFTFHQSSNCLNPKWILLDSQSTADIFCNAALLSDIHESGRWINIHCNAGVRQVTKVGTLKNYGEVWYFEDAIASILSLAKMSKRYPVKFNSVNGNQFVIIQPNKEVIFKQSKSGLYFHDTMNREVVMVNTVKVNREGYTQRQYDGAKAVRHSHGLVGYPSSKDYTNMVRSNMIRDCPITSADVKLSNKIFGPGIASLKGKTTRNTPEPILTDYVKIPKAIIDLNQDVTLAADIMFVDSIPFLISVSCKIKFTTSEYVPRHTKPILLKSLKKYSICIMLAVSKLLLH
jgi:hypothetical protein